MEGDRKMANAKFMSWIAVIAFIFSVNTHFSSKIHIFSAQSNKIIRRFLWQYRLHATNYFVRSTFLISFVFSDRSDRWIARMTGRSWNDRKAWMTGKPEQPESRNYKKNRKDRIDPSANILAKRWTLHQYSLGVQTEFGAWIVQNSYFADFFG
jgi:hypothetical protein